MSKNPLLLIHETLFANRMKTTFKNILNRKSNFIELETILDSKLPDEYKSFIERYNGAELFPMLFEVNNQKIHLTKIIPFYELIERHLFLINHKKFLMFVAEDDFGNGVLLSLKGINKYKYFFYDHETSEHFFGGNLNESNYAEKLTFIANSFEDIFENPIFGSEPELFILLKSCRFKEAENYIENFSYDINSIKDEHYNTLDIAIQEGAPLTLLKKLLEKNICEKMYGLNRLAIYDQADEIELFLEYEEFKFALNEEKKGTTALSAGISNLSENAVDILLKNGAKVRKEDIKLAEETTFVAEERKFPEAELSKARRILELIKST